MKTLVLLSGGIDSALAAYLAADEGDVVNLFINYGQSRLEADAALKVACWLSKPLLYTEVTIPLSSDKHGINFIPSRNLVLLSIALSYAISNECDTIAIGANLDDYNDYIDCRADFMDQFKVLAKYYKDIVLFTPLISMPKRDIIAYAYHKGIPFELTHTCYTPQDDLACGHCNACMLRLSSFTYAGLSDPVQYVKVEYCKECTK